MNNVKAELVQNRLVIWDPEKGTDIYRLGFFGRPIGISKPREKEKFNTPLILDPLEGLYLAERDIIHVLGPARRHMTLRGLKNWARKTYADFDIKYTVYKDLREKGYVVLPGIKYGCDFIVYEKGPGVDHAPFMVQVKRLGEVTTAADIVRAGRLATTVRKKFINALVGSKGRVRYLVFKWWRP